MPTYLHTYIHTYIHTHIHTQTYIPTYLPTYLHTYTHRHTYLRTYLPTYLHTYVPTYLRTYVHTYIHTYIHACMHTYIHTWEGGPEDCPPIPIGGGRGGGQRCTIYIYTINCQPKFEKQCGTAGNPLISFRNLWDVNLTRSTCGIPMYINTKVTKA